MNRSAFEEILALARQAGIVVRHAHLGGSGGGLAKVGQKRQLFVDLDADPDEQLERTVSALAPLDEIRQATMSAAARALLAPPRPSARPQ